MRFNAFYVVGGKDIHIHAYIYMYIYIQAHTHIHHEHGLSVSTGAEPSNLPAKRKF